MASSQDGEILDLAEGIKQQEKGAERPWICVCVGIWQWWTEQGSLFL